MKNILLAAFLFIGTAVNAQDKKKFDKPTVVEASCGECQFGMKGKSCDLAVRIDGKSYFVDGTTIHDHGDAHADNGFCNAVRKASVTGEIKGNRFVASSFTLIDEKK
ncbi:DUF6370 family protein [Flavobacterium hungaricum]|uniref:Glutaminyl-tRNA synthetase n=1 Tax=Flavobacterium hungaricum TaxID=2082725 RepID=A0ABR9TJT5_9FLAO|nr:DUF6370 family protein [Flavobacterium hungaricum]MBE8725618.1 hypothetical protein [Flavobacterium hungaricum]